jgi:WhiB family transcriptional regulator, redox-sensing transcriptional regulator
MVMKLSGQRERDDWRERAACRTADPEWFFPVSAAGRGMEEIARAKAVCCSCRVRRECLQFALATHQAYGVWGGTSEEERRPPAAHQRVPDQRRGDEREADQHGRERGASASATARLA